MGACRGKRPPPIRTYELTKHPQNIKQKHDPLNSYINNH